VSYPLNKAAFAHTKPASARKSRDNYCCQGHDKTDARQIFNNSEFSHSVRCCCCAIF